MLDLNFIKISFHELDLFYMYRLTTRVRRKEIALNISYKRHNVLKSTPPIFIKYV